MSSLIKTFYNNKLFHDTFPESHNQFKPNEVRFTKVLTKYSTEYNNIIFIYNLCQEIEVDKKDLVTMFQELRLFNQYIDNQNKEFAKGNKDFIVQEFDIENIFENSNITKLDIRRMYRYLDKNIKKESGKNLDDDLEEEFVE
jgi:hypothetical protein